VAEFTRPIFGIWRGAAMIFAEDISWQQALILFAQIMVGAFSAWLAYRKSEDVHQLRLRADASEQKATEAEQKATVAKQRADALEATIADHKKKGANRYSKMRRVVQRMRERHREEMRKQEDNWNWDRKQKHYTNNVNMILMAKLHDLGVEVDLPPPPVREPPPDPKPKG